MKWSNTGTLGYTSVIVFTVIGILAAGATDDDSSSAPKWTPEALQIFYNELRQVLTTEEAKLRSVMLCLRHMQPGPMLMSAFLSCCQVSPQSSTRNCATESRDTMSYIASCSSSMEFLLL